MFDFRQITLFCFEKRLSKDKMTMLSKNLGGGHDPSGSPWLRLWLQQNSAHPRDQPDTRGSSILRSKRQLLFK